MKILLRLPNWIGDVCMLLPSIETIKENFPESEIYAFGRSPSVDVLKNYPSVSTVKVGKSKIEELKSFYSSKKYMYDIAFVFPNSFISAFEVFLSGARERVGYSGEARSLFLNRAFPKNFSYSYHFSNYYLNLLKTYGLKPTEKKKFKLYLSEEEKEKGEEFLKINGLNGRSFIGISPGAAFGKSKIWGIEKFKALIAKIKKDIKFSVVLFGSKKEEPICKALETDGVLNLCGETSIREAMTIIDRASVFVANDSGLMHVASLLSVPVISIFGPTVPESTHPIGENYIIHHRKVACSPCKLRRCKFDFHLCMEVIMVDEVFKSIVKFLPK